MFRLVEYEDREILQSGISTKEEAEKLMSEYEVNDRILGVWTDYFYDIEEYE